MPPGAAWKEKEEGKRVARDTKGAPPDPGRQRLLSGVACREAQQRPETGFSSFDESGLPDRLS
jgi:hypothetical protein